MTRSAPQKLDEVKPHMVDYTALNYASQGFAVFPVVYKNKVPAVATGLKAATTYAPDVNRMFAGREVNIGIATGAASGNVLVVDLDGDEGIASWAAITERHGHEDTLTARTGGNGYHIYFRFPQGFIARNRAGLWPGVDIRGDGGYVVAPPSVHESGRKYEWVNPQKGIQDCPRWLLDTLAVAPPKEPSPATDREARGAGVIEEGGRNDTLMRMAGSMRRCGFNEQAITRALLSQNADKCNPPLPEVEVEMIARSASRYEPSAPIAPTSQSRVVHASAYAPAMYAYLEDRGRVSGEPTGIEGLDKLLGGGKRLGEITAWQGQAKTGKNALWHKMMHTWLARGVPNGYASFEMVPSDDVLPNLLSIETQSNVWEAEVRRGLYDPAIAKWPLYFNPGLPGSPLEDTLDWMADLKRIGVQHFWFDHLQYMLSDPSEWKEGISILRGLREYAKTERVHIDLIIQPKQLDKDQKLGINTLNGGAALCQLINTLMILERTEEDNILKVKLLLGRSRQTRPGSIHMMYNPETTDYVEVERCKEEDVSARLNRKQSYFNQQL